MRYCLYVIRVWHKPVFTPSYPSDIFLFRSVRFCSFSGPIISFNVLICDFSTSVIRHRDSLSPSPHSRAWSPGWMARRVCSAQQTWMQACLAPARFESIQSCVARFLARSARVSGPVSQAPRPHGGSFPGSSLGAAPYETIPLVYEVPGSSFLLAVPSLY